MSDDSTMLRGAADAVAAAIKHQMDPVQALQFALVSAGLIDDPNARLARFSIAVARAFEQETSTEILTQSVAMVRVIGACKRALQELDEHGRAELNLPFLAATGKGPLHFQRSLTRTEFAALLSNTVAPQKSGWWPFR